MLRIMLLAGWEKMGKAYTGEEHRGAYSIAEHLQPGEGEPTAGAGLLCVWAKHPHISKERFGQY